MTNKIETDAEEQQEHLTSLVNRCMVFAKRKGKDLSREYKWQNFLIKHGFRHTDIGTCLVWCDVRYKNRLVLEASGNHMTGHDGYYNITATIYIPGAWEKKIPELS